MPTVFVRYESFGQFIRLYPVVTFIVALNTLLFLPSLLAPTFYYFYIYGLGVGSNEALAAGQWWRLVTPIFLHGGIGHYVFNTFALIIFGPALERMVGPYKFFLAYLTAGIAGNLGTYFFQVSSHFYLGASGAIYGLLGIYFYMRFFRKDLIDPQSAQIVTTFLIIGAIYTLIVPRVSILGHLFGFVGGTVVAPLLFTGMRKYFTTLSSNQRSSHDNDVVSFDPQRWEKKRKLKKKLRVTFGVILGILVIIGLLSRFT
ncbi:rhomboid family intramembrane serine protease [Caldalkalibacillus salinus]|uniref:rhomboid family intramembrane serine protease n=1 Tax=Caldalkalibacillus salinus TaxID=2803787 RepID=UPI00301A0880